MDQQDATLLRDARVAQLQPQLYRVRLDWPRVQAGREQPIAWDRKLLQFLAAQQRPVILSVYGENPWWPHWANIDDYKRFLGQAVDDLLAVAPIMAVSPWNEPNHGAFNPNQRDRRGHPQSPGWYAREIWPAALEAIGTRKLTLLAGDLAGGAAKLNNQSRIGIPEWLNHVGRSVLRHGWWAVHDYTPQSGLRTTASEMLAHELAKHGNRQARILVTEAGALRTKLSPQQAARVYRQMFARWHKQGVAAVVQYTLKDDPGWPCGLWNDAGDLPALGAVQARPR